MPTVSVSVPKEMKKRMENMPQINWSAIAREAFNRRLTVEEFYRITEKSKLTEKDAKEIADRIDRAASKRFLEEIGETSN